MRFLLAAVFVWLAWRAVKETRRGKSLVGAVRAALASRPAASPADDEARRELGVPRTASDDDVRRAYRALAKRHHPDVVPEGARDAAEDKMLRIQRAYDRLLRKG